MLGAMLNSTTLTPTTTLFEEHQTRAYAALFEDLDPDAVVFVRPATLRTQTCQKPAEQSPTAVQNLERWVALFDATHVPWWPVATDPYSTRAESYVPDAARTSTIDGRVMVSFFDFKTTTGRWEG